MSLQCSTIVRWFKTRRNMMTGIVGAGVSVGQLDCSLLAAWLISAYDWQLSFAIMGCVILIVVIVSATVSENRAYQNRANRPC